MGAVVPPRVSRWDMVKLLIGLDPRSSAAIGVLIVVAGVLAPAITFASGEAVRSIGKLVAADASTGTVVVVATFIAVLFVIDQVVAPILVVAAQRFARRVDRWMVESVMASMTRTSGLAEVEDPAHQDLVLVGLGRSDWARPAGDFVTGAADQWPRRIAGAGAILLVGRWNVWLAILLPAVSLVGLHAWRQSFFSVMAGPETDMEDVRAASYALGLATNSEFSRESRIFEMRPWLLQRHDTLWLRAMRPVWRHRKQSSYLVAAAILANAAVRLLGLGLLGRSALRGDVSAAVVAVVAPSIINASHLTWISGGAELGMQRCLATVGAVVALRDRSGRAVTTPGRTIVEGVQQAIRLESVSFAYPGGADVVRAMDLELPARQSTAIVGFNGAGKTTTAKLLCGLYQPTAGRITIDGVDLADLDPTAWYRQTAAIFQDFGRYPLSVRENVGWGAPDHLDDLDGIRRAAERAGAMSFVDALPDGLDTILDRRFVGGSDASGGEWQRIAIARALFAVDHGASLLVLDEPTAQLDARAEADIYDRFLELTAGITSVVISHRFSTIRKADQIVVLEGGAIIEQGAHDQLIALDGRYATLFRIQADALIAGSGRADE